MQMLPLATRQPMDLALLMPGTSQDAVRARKANSNIGAGRLHEWIRAARRWRLDKEGKTPASRGRTSAVGNPGIQGDAEPVAR